MTFDIDAIQREADQITQPKETDNWLSVAHGAIISQTDFIEAPETVCYLDHTPTKYSLLTRGSISTFTGKAKAGKTSVMAVLIASALKTMRILWIDTEQGRYYASRTQHYVLSAANLSSSSNLEMYDLRAFSPEERLQIIEALLKDSEYDLVILDGVRDIVFDINNPEQATIAITKLMKWSVDFNCHITMVLHQNKGNSDVRGHLGTEAINKSEIVISVNKIDDSCGMAVVSAEFCRSMPFEDFYINRDESGMPFIDSDYVQAPATSGRRKLNDPIDFSDPQHVEILNLVFKNSVELTSGEFISALCSAWSSKGGNSLSETRAKTFRSYYIQKEFIVTQSNQKGNRTMNTLNEIHRVG